mgnify:FL=1
MRFGRVSGLNRPNDAVEQGVGYMLWPKSGKYEYCYKTSNSKFQEFWIQSRRRERR